MANYEKRLVHKIIQTQTIDWVRSRNITVDDFLDSTYQMIFRSIVDYVDKYGSVPGPEWFASMYPNQRLEDIEEPETFIADQVRWMSDKVVMIKAQSEFVDAYDNSEELNKPEVFYDGLAILQQGIRAIESSTANSAEVDLGEVAIPALIDKILNGGLDDNKGWTTGFPTIDKETDRFSAGELITFTGLAGAGKSTALLLSAIAAHSEGANVLFISFEMSNVEQQLRYLSITAEVPHSSLRNGTLTSAQHRRVKQLTESDLHEGLVFMRDASSTQTVSGVRSMAEKFNADIVFVDGTYMMIDEEKGATQSENITNITRGLKRTASHLEIPIVISTQELKSKIGANGPDAYSAGYSASFAQDSSLVFSVQSMDPENVGNGYHQIKCTKNRNGGLFAFTTIWDWNDCKWEEVGPSTFDMDFEDS